MTISSSIIATLSYHDIFNYPLTLFEIHQYLIEKRVNLKIVENETKKLVKKKKIFNQKRLYYLKNKSILVKLCSQRRIYSKYKLKKAQKYTNILKLIPTLNMVAISGALAMNNSHKEDDIDLFLITTKGNLWTTRFMASVVLHPYRRKPQSDKISDKACLNIFFDESRLNIKNKNIYTAHEIAQLKPIWDRGETYTKLLKANIWIKKYLPNWEPTIQYEKLKRNYIKLSIAEYLLKKFQLNYMHSKITTEKINKNQLYFHPLDTKQKILIEYKKRVAKLND